MKKTLGLLFSGFYFFAFSQQELNIPTLIPFSINQKSGYINQNGKIMIAPVYHIAMFFLQDCNLLNSPNQRVRLFGSSEFATVEKDEISYRINKKGKRVYQYKKEDLGKCLSNYEPQKYNAYIVDGRYGLVSKENILSEKFDQFVIAPTYQSLQILDGDADDPIIVAVMDDKFGVINKDNEVVIPFVYEAIKPNLSWKTVRLFEVSANGNDYFYIDVKNHAYKSTSIK